MRRLLANLLGFSTKRPSRPTPPRKVRPSLEVLEQRDLLTVTVGVSSGVLYIIGDTQANAITIRHKAGDASQTEVLDATNAVVGASANASFAKISAALAGGDDSLFLDDTYGSPIPAGGVSFDGGTGVNTLFGPHSSATWTVSGPNAGDRDGLVTFSKVQNLFAGFGDDTFKIKAGAYLDGYANGSGGANTLDYASFGAAVSVHLDLGTYTALKAGVNNIQTVVGSSGYDTIAGYAGANPYEGGQIEPWRITGLNSGVNALRGLQFSSFENVKAGAIYYDVGYQDNVFQLADGASLSGSITGGDGNDTVTLGANASVGHGGIRTAKGKDTITLGYNDAVGGIDAGADDDTVTLGSRDTVAFVDGGTGTNALAGPASPNVWSVGAAFLQTWQGTLNGQSFIGFQTLVGSTGTDTLRGPDTPSTWHLTGSNQGDVQGFTFRSMDRLTGGAADDVFAIAPSGSLGGSIDGGAGRNTLDYSAWSQGVTVNLSTGAASAVSTASAIAIVIGGAGADTLTGNDLDNVLAGNGGVDHLYGNGGRDIVIGGAGADVVQGGAGEDIVIGCRTKWDIQAAALAALLSEWSRADASRDARIAHLSGTLAGGLNGTTYLNAASVFNDYVADALAGGSELNWFFVNSGDSLIALATEKFTTI